MTLVIYADGILMSCPQDEKDIDELSMIGRIQLFNCLFMLTKDIYFEDVFHNKYYNRKLFHQLCTERWIYVVLFILNLLFSTSSWISFPFIKFVHQYVRMYGEFSSIWWSSLTDSFDGWKYCDWRNSSGNKIKRWLQRSLSIRSNRRI